MLSYEFLISADTERKSGLARCPRNKYIPILISFKFCSLLLYTPFFTLQWVQVTRYFNIPFWHVMTSESIEETDNKDPHLGVWTYQCFRSCTRYGSISKRWRRLDFCWTVLGQVREFNVGLGLSDARQCGARVFQDFKDFVRCSKTIWRRRANVVAFPYCCRVAKHATCFLLSRQSQKRDQALL